MTSILLESPLLKQESSASGYSSLTEALRLVSLAFTGTSLIFWLIQLYAMIAGGPFSLFFEMLWTLMNAFYPSSAIYFMLQPDLEKSLLLDYFWIVYIAVPVQLALIFLNFDLHLGSAAKQLDI